jgi:hypothetical protein
VTITLVFEKKANFFRRKLAKNRRKFGSQHPIVCSQIDWAHREAMLLLREREAAGVTLIDKNFVDPAKLELPTDEELGDTEIIV